MAPHSSTLAWKIPWTEELGRLQSMGLLKVGHNWATSLSLFTFMHWRRKWQPIPVFLLGEIQGQRSLVGCCLWGRTESDMTVQIKITMRYHLIQVRMAIINSSTNNKCWEGCGKKRVALHFWWVYKLVQPLWRTVWKFLKKTKKSSHMTQQSQSWAYIQRKTILWKYTPRFSLQHYLQQPGRGTNLNVHQQMNKEDGVHTYNKYTMEYNSVIKKESIPFASTGMDLNIIILSANRQRKICITWYY